jgi:hypothetical protein
MVTQLLVVKGMETPSTETEHEEHKANFERVQEKGETRVRAQD